ncbi:membrane protein implicated in regulation of membrane protease activity [Roseospira marina]|nr:membrane protein implicated in regulation of membrane protease activity [Roseospira marina]MBB5087455.1 membrane protein implicated in regulation of membrane protease activity [Roseospira marina]
MRVDDGEWAAVAETDALSAPEGTAMRVTGVRDGRLVLGPEPPSAPAPPVAPDTGEA